jgi:DNA-binding transcriptional MerR regulator/methylmalonyl-CoA mutase cobalamin-binding subunit
MYTIKQAAARSGVPVPLLRAWERRYGVVSPSRTRSGYRLYEETDVARLRAMRRLIGEGWSASTAAAEITSLDDSAVEELLGPPARGEAERDAAASSPTQVEGLPEAFVESASALDEAGVEELLDDMFSRGSFEHVATSLVMPALVALGDGWANGRVDVAAEHAAANAVQRRLGMAFVAAGSPGGQRDVVLVGLPPGARHDLGALAFATAARRGGVSVRYLGADLPLQDWLDALLRTKARAVVIGVVIGDDVEAAERVARALRAADEQVLICFGGRAATDVNVARLEPFLRLPDDLSASVQALRDGLR